MTHTFNPTILREYDIRGIVGDTLTEADAYALGRTYAALARDEGARRIAVGRDGRTHSRHARSGAGPRPHRRRHRRRADRHGPLADALFRDPLSRRRRRHPGHRQPQPGRLQRLQAAAEGPLGVRRGDPGDRPPRRRRRLDRAATATTEEVDIREAYVDRLLAGLLGQGRSASAGTPATAPPGRSSTSWSSGCRASITRSSPTVDGRFPNHHPDPTVEANLADLKQLVADKQLDFGIAFDGDGDRIGAVDGKGRVIWGDQLMLILAEPVLKELPGATIIADVKASQVLFDGIAALGGKPLMWKTGHSLIKSKMKETGAPLAGEMSGHIFFKHRWYGFDDALYAAVRLIEAVSASGKSLTEIMDAMPKTRRDARAALPGRRSRASSRSSRKSATACPPTAPRSTPPTASASAPPTAGGCCAPRTRRTCWSRAPRRRTRPGSTAWSRRSTSSWRSQAWSAWRRSHCTLRVRAE